MTEVADFSRYHIFWRRFWAGAIDSIVLLPIYWIDRWIWESFNTAIILIPWFLLHSFSFVLYTVLLHGYFGQTLGKRLMGIKVFNVDGGKLLMRQAILRDCVIITLIVYGLTFDLPLVAKGLNPYGPEVELSVEREIAVYASLVWFALELITMLSNSKRRAIHDFIAGSVVMRVST